MTMRRQRQSHLPSSWVKILFLLSTSLSSSSSLETAESTTTFLQEIITAEGEHVLLDPYNEEKIPRIISDDSHKSTLSSVCQDTREQCPTWRQQGRCAGDKYVYYHCPVSCDACHEQFREHVPLHEAFYYNKNQRKRTIVSVAGDDLGVPQILPPHNDTQPALRLLQKGRGYFQDVVLVQPRYLSVRQLCRNRHSFCTVWALDGECDADPDYMMEECPLICQVCHELHIEARCPLDPNARNAWYPGDLNRMFVRILEEFPQYHPQVLSSPNDGDDGPWLVQLEDFLSQQEADTFIQWGSELGYKRSTEVGLVLADGTNEDRPSQSRTSENAWCEDGCDQDPVVLQVMERIENLTGIPSTHSELLQLLRYEPGQFYRSHNDYIDFERNRREGPRILTVFLYLNDVEEGGGTLFNSLGITVQPKRGRIVIWPSVLNERPFDKDERTVHEALPVIQGLKYGANAWFHQRDYQDSDC